MRAAPGIGITGPHIGASWRITILELAPGEVRNTSILRLSGNPMSWKPTKKAVSQCPAPSRPSNGRPVYMWLTRILTASRQQNEATGLLAVCLQHEIDQLDGIFWIHRLSRLKRDRLVKK